MKSIKLCNNRNIRVKFSAFYSLNSLKSLQLVDQYGTEAERHRFRSLFSSIDFSVEGKGSGKDFQQVEIS